MRLARCFAGLCRPLLGSEGSGTPCALLAEVVVELNFDVLFETVWSRNSFRAARDEARPATGRKLIFLELGRGFEGVSIQMSFVLVRIAAFSAAWFRKSSLVLSTREAGRKSRARVR